MAITRKPKVKTAAAAGVDVEKLIRKGGSVAKAESPAEEVPVLVRVPADVLSRVGQAVSARKIKIPRHTWLLEAIVEKLERESF